MIENLTQLVTFTQELAKQSPLIASELLLKTPGCSQAELEKLRKALPGIPESYITILEQIQLQDFSLSYFQLSPSFSKKSIVDALIEQNTSNQNPLLPEYKKDKTYEVAHFDADVITIAYQDGTFKKGQVVRYDYESAPHIKAMVLADSFEQFLLIVANLVRIQNSLKDEPSSTKGLSEFRKALKALFPKRTTETNEMWEEIAKIMLD